MAGLVSDDSTSPPTPPRSAGPPRNLPVWVQAGVGLRGEGRSTKVVGVLPYDNSWQAAMLASDKEGERLLRLLHCLPGSPTLSVTAQGSGPC